MPMLKPGEKETKEAFISRFMADEKILSEYPEQSQRAAIAYKEWGEATASDIIAIYCATCGECIAPAKAEQHRDDGHKVEVVKKPGKAEAAASSSSWPERFRLRVVCPGIIDFTDMGLPVILAQKPVLDRLCATAEGKPIVNFVHKKVKPEDYANARVEGLINKLSWVASDGWYWADIWVWDDATKVTLRDPLYSNSLAFILDKLGPGGLWNKVAYEAELEEGTLTHIAIVDNPRITGARNEEGGLAPEALNSTTKKEGGAMNKLVQMWKSLTEKKEAKASTGKDPEKSYRMVDGEKVYLKDLMSESAADKEEAEKKKQFEKDREGEIGEDEVYDVGGEGKTVKEMVATFTARKQAKAEAASADMKKEHEDGTHRDKAAESCAMCASEKDEKEKKDAESAAAEKEKKEAESALVAKAKQEALSSLNDAHGKKAHEGDKFSDSCPACQKAGKEAFLNLEAQASGRRGDPLVLPATQLKTDREKAAESESVYVARKS